MIESRAMKNKKALILRHTNGTSPGTSLEWLAKNNFDVTIIMTRNQLNWDQIPRDFDMLFICGGEMNVDQEHLHPWLKDEKKFIAEAIKNKKKIVGLCLGSQLLAEVLGGKVEKAPHQEVGWVPMNINTENPFMQHSLPQIKVFAYHGYRFHTPANANRFAQNSFLPDQGFSFSNHVVAFQFHPESTTDWVGQCVLDDSPPWPEGKPGVQSAKDTLADMHLQPVMEAWYYKTLDNLLLAT